MALAAATTAYPDDTDPELVSVGPTLKNCSIMGNGIQIFFDEEHLKGDSIHVFDSLLGPDFDLPKTLTSKLCTKLEGGAASPFCSSYGGITPLEVQYTVPVNGSNTTVWVPTSMKTSNIIKINKNCKPGTCTNWTKTAGWNSVTTHVVMPKTMLGLPVAGSKLVDYITGVRYGWSAGPCCPYTGGNLPCPPNSCPIRGWNSTLPANPFFASIVGGKCVCTPPQIC